MTADARRSHSPISIDGRPVKRSRIESPSRRSQSPFLVKPLFAFGSGVSPKKIEARSVPTPKEVEMPVEIVEEPSQQQFDIEDQEPWKKARPAQKQFGLRNSDSTAAQSAPSPRPPRQPLTEEQKEEKIAKNQARKQAKWLKDKKKHFPEKCSSEDVRWRDIISVLGKETVDQAIEEGREFDFPYNHADKPEIELDIVALGSEGDGIGLAPDTPHPWAIVVPFSLPGERVRARVYGNERLYSLADMVEIVKPNLELRDDSLVKCKYFSKCAGCQYQMLPYSTQLDIKRNVIVKAYQHFSAIPEDSVPEILPTTGSPLQYGYRTKITPHFNFIGKAKRATDDGNPEVKPDWLKIGFNQKGMSNVLDIEDCPIATDVIQDALGPARAEIVRNRKSYKRGVTLLLRDSLDNQFQNRLCVTNPKAVVREEVDGFKFEYHASAFFQNNSSILPVLTQYVRESILGTSDPYLSDSETEPGAGPDRLTHLIDAYCGSGLFAITLSPYFKTIKGIEISKESIEAAQSNQKLNNIPSKKLSFQLGDAGGIFSNVKDFPGRNTVLVMDPPRKGSDLNFLNQVKEFGPQVVLYVSCNVHTQARDVGELVKDDGREGRARYRIVSIRGFDLFPQTSHVESVAILRRID